MSSSLAFAVKTNEQCGGYLVANRSLKSGDFIVEDSPFAFGPKSESPPLCLGCFSDVDCTILCPKCSWPLCTAACESLKLHQDNECEIFAKSGCKFQPVDDPTDACLQYECITPLRVLLAKERDPNRWTEEVEVLKSHNDKRRLKPIWQFNQINIVDFLRGPCKLDVFSEDLIHTVCGILEVNALDVVAPSGHFIKYIFPKFGLMQHNCVQNVHYTVQNYKLRVRAAVDIAPGAQLYQNSAYSLWPTLTRRAFLQQNKHLSCSCKRCVDKTELGTHLGTLKCSKCDNGVILSTDPSSDSCEWKCTHCQFKTNAVLVRRIYDIVQAELEAVEPISGAEGIERREAIYRKYRSVFHPKCAYMTMLRVGLTQLYGRAEGYTIHELPDVLQERKVELCCQLLEVLDVVEPGLSKIRGITLYELHAPLINLAKSEYDAEVITKDEFRTKMKGAIDILRKSVEILQFEPEGTDEGQLGVVAKEAYDHLVENFDMLVDTA